jgi:serine/threonine protein kinase
MTPIRYLKWFEELVRTGNFVAVGVSGPAASGNAQGMVPRYMYNARHKIGTGGSSDVFLGLQCDDGMELALKRISLPANQQGAEVDKRFETEVNLLKTRYGMPGLVNYLGHVVAYGVDRDQEPTVDHFIALELMECDIKQLIGRWEERRGLPGHLLACQVRPSSSSL